MIIGIHMHWWSGGGDYFLFWGLTDVASPTFQLYLFSFLYRRLIPYVLRI
jgi:hypothetical protein